MIKGSRMNQIIEKALTVKSLVVISHRFTWEGLVKLQYTKETIVRISFENHDLRVL